MRVLVTINLIYEMNNVSFTVHLFRNWSTEEGVCAPLCSPERWKIRNIWSLFTKNVVRKPSRLPSFGLHSLKQTSNDEHFNIFVFLMKFDILFCYNRPFLLKTYLVCSWNGLTILCLPENSVTICKVQNYILLQTLFSVTCSCCGSLNH